MLLDLLVGVAAAPTTSLPSPLPAEPGLLGELLELAKLLGGGAAGTFALLAWQALRHDRSNREDERQREVKVRSDRQRELDGRLERMSNTLARVDERTALLAREAFGGEKRGRRFATPPRGTPIKPDPDREG